MHGFADRPIAVLGTATMMGRMAGIEPASPEWRSGTGPSSYTRIGGKRRESNLLPHRDCVYGAATAPAVLIGASRKLAPAFALRASAFAKATADKPARWRAEPKRFGAKAGGELRVRTSVLADPSVFETDCRPLQRRSPWACRATAPGGREGWCISQGSNLEPIRYERTALPLS